MRIALGGYALMAAMLVASADGADFAKASAFEGFDPAATSPAAIAFDPLETEELISNFVGGGGLTTVAGSFTGTNINTFLGANTFYTDGYTGTNAVIANVEAGHVWTGHETLSTTSQISNNPLALNEFDRHATWVGMVLAGRPSGTTPGEYQRGMAYDAQLYSGAIAAQWSGTRYALSFSSFTSTALDQYRRAFNTGVNASGRRADVINSSFGGVDAAGIGTRTIGVDALANANPSTLFVASAGNSGPGPNQVGGPASGYNNMSVASLGANPTYNSPSSFSSGGPNDYSDPVNGTFSAARQVVDIAAPGEQLGSAYYGGTTGGNGTTDNPSIAGTGPTGAANGPAGGPDFYSRNIAGTSFAAPTVAGGAALLYDAAYSEFPTSPSARDARVVKAVLMNSADKTAGWNNGQAPHPNGQGGVRTTQALDNRVGTGRMNLDAAFDQYLTGTTDMPGMLSGTQGIVSSLGWDLGEVVSGTLNDYLFAGPLLGGSTFTATLTWFRDRRIDGSNNVFDESFDDLDLELWSTLGAVPTTLISDSLSGFNESEHFSFSIPATGNYALRVRWFGEVFDVVSDANRETYGLAWSAVVVPEPTAMVLLGTGVVIVAVARIRRRPRGR